MDVGEATTTEYQRLKSCSHKGPAPNRLPAKSVLHSAAICPKRFAEPVHRISYWIRKLTPHTGPPAGKKTPPKRQKPRC